MDTNTTSKDIFDPRAQEKPGMLNVLTILTFIGCGISYLGMLWGNINYDYERDRAQIEKMLDKTGDNNLASRMAESSLQLLEKNHEYRFLLLGTGLLFTTMCLIGAIQMRKLKKSGYYSYIIGEIAPIILSLALFGFSFVSGITAALSGLVAIVFVILYSTQLKYLK